MNLSDISQLISTVGFPIAAFAAIFYLYDKTVKELTTTITKIDTTLQHILTHLEIDMKNDTQSDSRVGC